MTLFIITFLLVCFGLIQKSKYKYLCNELFWFAALWVFIFGVYFITKVRFGTYGCSIELVLFMSVGFSLFILGRKHGARRKSYTVFQSEEKKNSALFSLLGLFGVFMLLFDIWRLNGIGAIIEREAGAKGEFSLSIIGVIGTLLVPILLVEGLYLIVYKIKLQNSFSILGLLLLIFYTIPSILDNGRETILYSIVGILSVYGYKSYLNNHIVKTKRKNYKRKVLIAFISISAISGLLYIMYQISIDRFGETEIRVFLLNNDVPSEVMKEAEQWGEFDFLYYNIVSYFGHQIPYFDFILKEYHGPYMFGMFEFNIVSRRLPDFLGLDYRLAFEQIHKLYRIKHTDFGNGWFTALGSFIIDYGRIGAVVVCSVCGYLVGNVRRKFILTKDPRYATLIGIICLSMISTVQLGPFYSTHIYGAFIWWYFIFLTKNKQRITIKKQ